MKSSVTSPTLPLLFTCIALLLNGAFPGRSAALGRSVVLPVDSPSVHFSPGNWAGDSGRGGKLFRQSWCSGAYCVWCWSTTRSTSSATLLASNQTAGSSLSYFLDGHLVDNVPVPAAGGISIPNVSGPGKHVLKVYLRESQQQGRWESSNACKITGLALDGDASPGIAPGGNAPWALLIGDSITEGIGAHFDGSSSSLSDYAFLVGQGLMQEGMETGVSACGYSGWIRPGDGTADVPPYYTITGSHDGVGGAYNDAASRWNKIDARTSLLDSAGHISAQGRKGQEPAMILINYGTNETLSSSNVSDMQASITQCLSALRAAAPHAWIRIFVPFGLESADVYPHGVPYIAAIKAGVTAYRAHNPKDAHVAIVDLGTSVANALASPLYGGGVHPNAAGHAFVAAQILPLVMERIHAERIPVKPAPIH